MSEVLYGDKDCEWTYEVADGLIFIHLEVTNWSKTLLLRLREVFDSILMYFGDQGHDAILATTDDEKSKKLWQMIKPYNDIETLEQDGVWYGWIGSWDTGGN